jgi:hypothetical protein
MNELEVIEATEKAGVEEGLEVVEATEKAGLEEDLSTLRRFGMLRFIGKFVGGMGEGRLSGDDLAGCF